ncbi:MAG: metal ABC transporter ATP-binding protein [Planctomycetota bacterium]
MTAAIRVEDLRFAYHGRGPTVLDQVSWEVPQNAFVALIGPNGGGKTTLLQLCLGLLRPDGGRVALLGAPPRRTRHRVGYIPQRDNIDTGTPHDALEVVLTGRLAHSRWGFRYSRADRERGLHALERVGLADQARRSLAELSGGQRQRVRIARALAAEAEMLMLDEPLTGVDPVTEEDLLGLLDELNRDHTIVMVSHDVACVSRHVTHVACCNGCVAMHTAAELSDVDVHHLYHAPGQCRPLVHEHGCPIGPGTKD